MSNFIIDEQQLHLQLCIWIKHEFPNIEFNSDLSGINQSKRQRVISSQLRSGRAFPDLIIYEPKGEYHGLFIELKRPGTIIYKKNGEIVKNKHIQEQEQKIFKLREKGYCAAFCVGFDDAQQFIRRYMKQ